MIRWLQDWFWHRWYFGTYLKSDQWHQTRAAVLKRDGYRCQDCGSRQDLQVHHLTYHHVGHERMDELITLCRNCHEKRHGRATGVLSGKGAAVFIIFLLMLLLVFASLRG